MLRTSYSTHIEVAGHQVEIIDFRWSEDAWKQEFRCYTLRYPGREKQQMETANSRVRFASFEVDLRSEELRKHGLRLRLPRQSFQVLVLLLQRPGEFVRREELRESLWPADTFVDFDHGLNAAVNRLRQALGDSVEEPRFIETRPRLGYRFIAPLDCPSEATTVSQTSVPATGMPTGAPELNRDPGSGDTALLTETAKAPEKERDPRYPQGADRPDNAQRIKRDSKSTSEPTPDLRIKPAVAIQAVSLALVLMAAVIFVLNFRATNLVRRAGTKSLSSPSIAVLGFRNLSQNSDVAWISGALSELLTTDLHTQGALRTISSEEVTRVKGDLNVPDVDSLAPDTLERIRRRTGADYVVLGSYLDQRSRSGGAIRVDLRVEDTRSGELVASLSENGSESDLPKIIESAGNDLREHFGVVPVKTRVETMLPSNPDAARLYSQGLQKLRNFEEDEARVLLEAASETDPRFPLAYVALADAWSHLGYPKKEIEVAKTAYQLSNNLPKEQQLLVEARFRKATGDWSNTIRLYEILSTSYPNDLEYGLDLADAQLNGSEPQQALQTLERLKRLPRGNDEPRLYLIQSQTFGGQWESAKAAAETGLKKAQAVNSKLAMASLLRALAGYLVETKDLNGAEERLRQAKEIYTELGDLRGVANTTHETAVYQSWQGNFAAARDAYNEALLADERGAFLPGEAMVLANLARLELETGNFSIARSNLQRAIKMYAELGNSESKGLALNDIATSWFYEGDLQRAEQAARETLRFSRGLEDRSVAARLELSSDQLLAEVACEKALYPLARRYLETAAELSRKSRWYASLYGVELALAKIELYETGKAPEIASKPANIKNNNWRDLQRVELLVLSGRLEAAATELSALDVSKEPDPVTLAFYSLCKARLLIAHRDYLESTAALKSVPSTPLPMKTQLEERQIRIQICRQSGMKMGSCPAAGLINEAERRGFVRIAQEARHLR